MKFKEGDTILLRGEITYNRVSGDVNVLFDGDNREEILNEAVLSNAVKYDPDLPLPGQKVWVRDNDNEPWEGPYAYIGKDKSEIYEHLVKKDNQFAGNYNFITTKNPHTKDRDAEIEAIEKRMREDADRLKKLREGE